MCLCWLLELSQWPCRRLKFVNNYIYGVALLQRILATHQQQKIGQIKANCRISNTRDWTNVIRPICLWPHRYAVVYLSSRHPPFALVIAHCPWASLSLAVAVVGLQAKNSFWRLGSYSSIFQVYWRIPWDLAQHQSFSAYRLNFETSTKSSALTVRRSEKIWWSILGRVVYDYYFFCFYLFQCSRNWLYLSTSINCCCCCCCCITFRGLI